MVHGRRMGLGICFLVCGIALGLWSPLSAAEPGRDGWHSDIPSAVKVAKQLERPILIYVASNGCAFCRQMERGTLNDPAVKSQVEKRFVGVSINGSSQPKIAKSLRIRAYPTTIVYGPDGNLITSRRGYVGPREFQELLQSIRAE